MIKTLAIALACLAGPAAAQTITSATYSEPTTRYGHAILGDAIEYGQLDVTFENLNQNTLSDAVAVTTVVSFRLPIDHVFEDVAPRLWDVDGDGSPEVVVVETDVARGAALAIYDETGKIIETPHIGRSNRWLAPVAATDMDGDGYIEIAYVDRPHLARRLRVLRYVDGALVPVTALAGVTNHRIGEADIGGGLRVCGEGPEMIVASADWTRVLAIRLVGDTLSATDIGPHRDRGSFATALACQPL